MSENEMLELAIHLLMHGTVRMDSLIFHPSIDTAMSRVQLDFYLDEADLIIEDFYKGRNNDTIQPESGQ